VHPATITVIGFGSSQTSHCFSLLAVYLDWILVAAPPQISLGELTALL